MAEGAEVGVSDGVEDDETDQEQDDEGGKADEEENTLAEGIPLAKGDVGDKDDGRHHPEYQATWVCVRGRERGREREREVMAARPTDSVINFQSERCIKELH